MCIMMKLFPLSDNLLFCTILNGTSVLVLAPEKENEKMKEKYIEQIIETIKPLDENKLLYILTFIKKLFGSQN